MQFPSGNGRVSEWVACNLFFWSGGRYGTHLYVHWPLKFRITLRSWQPEPAPPTPLQVANEAERR